MSHDSRGALLKKGDRVLVEFELSDEPSADNGYCNANCVAVVPDQKEKPPMSAPMCVFNTRMLTKVGASLCMAIAIGLMLVGLASPALAQCPGGACRAFRTWRSTSKPARAHHCVDASPVNESANDQPRVRQRMRFFDGDRRPLRRARH